MSNIVIPFENGPDLRLSDLSRLCGSEYHCEANCPFFARSVGYCAFALFPPKYIPISEEVKK